MRGSPAIRDNSPRNYRPTRGTMDEQFEDAPPQIEPTEYDLERFTDCARDALSSAEYAAQRLGDPFVGTDHLLVGLAMSETGAAFKVMEPFNVTPRQLEQSMKFIRGDESATPVNGNEGGYSPRLVRVLARATKEATYRGDARIGTIHMLLGLLRERQGLSVFLLEAAGLGPKRIDQIINRAQSVGWTDD
jgi:ATP-dependent Clp protease ATP-binding subunit ClpA